MAGLFAGIGGLELGLEQAGHHTHLLCENDEGAQAVLRAHFPGRKLHSDVCALRPVDLPSDLDLLVAGFPCQDLSQAGCTAGIEGERSSLVGEVLRLLRRRRVPWVLIENVPFMLRLGRGRAMDLVVGALEKLGYRWAYRVVDAMAFGLPQRRRRVFLVASLDGDPASVLFGDDASPRPASTWRSGKPVGFYWTEGNRGVGWAVNAVPTVKGGSGLGIPSPPAVLTARGKVVTPTIGAVERLQGFRPGWTEPAEQVVPARYRWRMVGNAVNVRVADWIGHRLAVPQDFDAERLGELGAGAPWPSAACNLGDGRRDVRIGEWPVRVRAESIASFLVGAKMLSARATEGFVTRAERAERGGKLRFAAGFLDSLRSHLVTMRGMAV